MKKSTALICLLLMAAGVTISAHEGRQIGFIADAGDGEKYLSALQEQGDPDVARVLGDINTTHKAACGQGYTKSELQDITARSAPYSRLMSLVAMDDGPNPGGVYQDELQGSFSRCK